MNGAVVMRLPPFVDLAVENRKLGGQVLVEVKHGCNRVRLSETGDKCLGTAQFAEQPYKYLISIAQSRTSLLQYGYSVLKLL
jgi:hypothetical protein